MWHHLNVNPIPLEDQSITTWLSSLDFQCDTTWMSIPYQSIATWTVFIRLPMWYNLTVDPLPLDDQSIATWTVFIRLPMWHHLTVNPIPLEDQSVTTWLSSLDCQCETTWLSIQNHLKTNQSPLDFNHWTSNVTPLDCRSLTNPLPLELSLLTVKWSHIGSPMMKFKWWRIGLQVVWDWQSSGVTLAV